MDLLTVILACSLHPDDPLVEAFIRKVSDANPLFLGDYVSLATHDDLTSPNEVLELAASISEKGGRPALGLMAIPISWAARFNRTPTDLLDACTNISIGTAMMASFVSECGARARHSGRSKHSTRVAPRQLPDREILDCRAIVSGYASGPRIDHGLNRACYSPIADRVSMPATAVIAAAQAQRAADLILGRRPEAQ